MRETLDFSAHCQGVGSRAGKYSLLVLTLMKKICIVGLILNNCHHTSCTNFLYA